MPQMKSHAKTQRYVKQCTSLTVEHDLAFIQPPSSRIIIYGENNITTTHQYKASQRQCFKPIHEAQISVIC